MDKSVACRHFWKPRWFQKATAHSFSWLNTIFCLLGKWILDDGECERHELAGRHGVWERMRICKGAVQNGASHIYFYRRLRFKMQRAGFSVLGGMGDTLILTSSIWKAVVKAINLFAVLLFTFPAERNLKKEDTRCFKIQFSIQLRLT